MGVDDFRSLVRYLHAVGDLKLSGRLLFIMKTEWIYRFWINVDVRGVFNGCYKDLT